MRSFEVDVNGTVLKWARENAGVEIPEVAKRLGRSTDVIEQWERGDRKPTLTALENLAQYYKRPITALMLDKPPDEPPLPRDFRTLPGKKGLPLSRSTRLAIRTARRLQRIVSTLGDELNMQVKPAIETTTTRKSPEKLAAEQRRRLDVSVDEQQAWKDGYTAFRRWREAIEGLNILVFQMSMPVEEARGFSLAEPGVRVIVVNKSDSIRARIFTLFHEYAHHLLSTPGICLPLEDGAQRQDVEKVEQYCNQFAGAFLLPWAQLQDEQLATSARTSLDELLDSTSTRFWVSRQVVLRRLLTAGLLSKTRYEKAVRTLTAETGREKAKPKFVPQAPERRCLTERGHFFTSIILQAQNRQLITRSDVSDYLGVRSKHIDNVRSLL